MDLDDLLNRIAALPEDQKRKVYAEAHAATKDMPWVPNPGPQSEAYFSDADELFYGGQAGGGKALNIEAPVLTPTGWKPIGALKVGDPVCATDGTVQEVIGVFPQGVRPLYRVTMRDGASTLADLDHNWLAWRTHASGKKANKACSGKDSARKWTTRQMLAEMSKAPFADGRARGFATPVIEPVAFNVAGQVKGRGEFVGREVDPYLLGLILGDGCIQPKKVSITSADEYIIERVCGMVGEDVAVDSTSSLAKSLRFRGSFNRYLLASLARLGLAATGAAEKFVPRQYLFAPAEVRWEILRGLLDTDGWVEPKRGVFFTSISKQLAQDVAHLAFSLGCVSITTVKEPTFTYKGEKRRGRTAYCVRIKAPRPEECFALPRKQEIAGEIKHQSLSRVVESIEYERDGEAVCIAVSNANSLYITEGFIVTHNSDLEIGLSLTAHKRALLLRRTNKEALGLVDRLAEIVGSRDGWNSQAGAWRLSEKVIDIGGCQLEEDKQKYKGTPHDLICFDEVSDFTRTQYKFITTWNRSADPKQRCRVVCAGNPPTRPEGLWVIEYWAAWLDPQHHNPARPGELRWYTTIEGKDVEVDGPGPHTIQGEPEPVMARSRTFIPAKLSDNPDLASTNYASVLAALPEELRLAYRDGRFDVALNDDAFQSIPTAWVKAAQERWRPTPPVGVPMCAIGVDVAQGGQDNTVLAIRHDGWFAPFIVVPGVDTPDGKKAAGLVIANRRNDAKVIVDIGGGWGGDCYAHLRENGVDAVSYMGVKQSLKRTVDKQLKFFNVRSEAYWRFREALDPSQPGGAPIALPPDPALVADLCAPKYEVSPNGIKVEPKEKVCDRIGRSTDRGDAAVMAWWDGLKQVNVSGGWKGRRQAPKVILAHSGARRGG